MQTITLPSTTTAEQVSHVVLDAVLEEVDKVGKSGRTAKAGHGAARQAAAEASAVDVRVGRAGLAALDAALRRQAEERDDVEDGREHGRHREVVAAHRDDQVVGRCDVVAYEPVLGQQAAARAVVEAGRLDGRVETEEVWSLASDGLAIEPVADVQLLRGRAEYSLVAVQRGCVSSNQYLLSRLLSPARKMAARPPRRSSSCTVSR